MKIETIYQADREMLLKKNPHNARARATEPASGETLRVYVKSNVQGHAFK